MKLLPQPKVIQTLEGLFEINYRGTIRIATDCDEVAFDYAQLLKKEIHSQLGADYEVKMASCHEGHARDYAKECLAHLKSNEIHFKIVKEDGKSTEGYHLLLDGKQAAITGYGNAGLLCGVQTLRQLIREYGARIPAVEIWDEPAILNRGFYQDVSRGRIPTLQQLKELADVCSFYKLNQLQLYVEDSYLFEGFGETWREDTPLTAEEIKEFDRYCRLLQIKLVPSLSSFGHLYGVLRTKQYRNLCELEVKDGPFYLTERMEHHTVDVTNEDSFFMLESRILEYMKLFTSDIFNICADETFDLGKGKSRELVEKQGESETYLAFLERLCKVVTDAGKKPMFWGDIIVKEAQCLSRLPEESICLNWEYDPCVREDNTKTFVEAGAKHLYVCPGVQSWHYLINHHHDAFRNIAGMCRLAHKYEVEGVLNTCWGDLGHMAHPEFATVGLAYGAALSWSREDMSEEEINSRISLLSYGDHKGTLVKCFSELSLCQTIRWWNMVAFKEWMQKKERLEECIGLINSDSKVLEANQLRRKEIEEKLYQNLLSVQVNYKDKVMAYLLMSEGQTLLERACQYIAKAFVEQKWDKPEESKALASSLEDWIMAYKKLWRSVSKESELHRIVDVVCWYADYLRVL